MARVFTFGKLLLRLQPFNYERFVQAQSVEFTFGGEYIMVTVAVVETPAGGDGSGSIQR